MTSIEFENQMVSLEKKLSRFAVSLTFDRDEAKDLLQETMLKAFTYRKQFVNHNNLKAWAYTIMKNTFINNYRRALRQQTTLDSSKNLYFLNQSRKIYDVEPDSHYAAQEINKLIDGLSDDLKVPFKLLLEGYKYKEISDMLDLKIGTVKSRIFFTRKKLMDLLDNSSE
jgi:RNA polymerase sigma factor (sigma-70 family)